MDNSIMNRVSEVLNTSILQHNPDANIDKSERLVSVGTGAFITLKGLTNLFSHPYLAVTELGIGGALLYRGVTGYCIVKDQMERSTVTHVPQSAMPVEAY